MWLFVRVIKSPFLKDKACCTLYWAPQMLWLASCDYGQPYLNFFKSQNSCLFKQYPSSFSDNVDNHTDAPFSCVCRSILVFHQTKNIVLHLIFVYFVEVSQVQYLSSVSLFLPCWDYKLYFVVTEALLMTQLELLSCCILFQRCYNKKNNTHPTILYRKWE